MEQAKSKLQAFDQELEVCFYVEERDCEKEVGRVEIRDVADKYDVANKCYTKKPAIMLDE